MSTFTTVTTVPTRDRADTAVRRLRAQGFVPDQLGVLASARAQRALPDDGAARPDPGTPTAGAALGAAIGGLGGLAWGPTGVAFGGALAALAGGAAAGGAVGGIVGALGGLGMDDDDVAALEQAVDAGSFLILVQTDDPTRTSVAEMELRRHAEDTPVRSWSSD